MGTLEGLLGFVMLIVILITINIILWTSEFQKEKRKNEGEKSEDEKKAEELLIFLQWLVFLEMQDRQITVRARRA